MEQSPAKGRVVALLFEPCPDSFFFFKVNEKYSIERLDVSLVNRGNIPKKQGGVYKMANRSRYLLDHPRTFINIVSSGN